MESDLLSKEHLGTVLKVSQIVAPKWWHEGEIPAAKFEKAYHSKKEDLDKWAEGKFLKNTAFQ